MNILIEGWLLLGGIALISGAIWGYRSEGKILAKSQCGPTFSDAVVVIVCAIIRFGLGCIAAHASMTEIGLARFHQALTGELGAALTFAAAWVVFGVWCFTFSAWYMALILRGLHHNHTKGK